MGVIVLESVNGLCPVAGHGKSSADGGGSRGEHEESEERLDPWGAQRFGWLCVCVCGVGGDGANGDWDNGMDAVDQRVVTGERIPKENESTRPRERALWNRSLEPLILNNHPCILTSTSSLISHRSSHLAMIPWCPPSPPARNADKERRHTQWLSACPPACSREACALQHEKNDGVVAVLHSLSDMVDGGW